MAQRQWEKERSAKRVLKQAAREAKRREYTAELKRRGGRFSWFWSVWTAIVCNVRRVEPQVCPVCTRPHPEPDNCPVCGCPPSIAKMLWRKLIPGGSP